MEDIDTSVWPEKYLNLHLTNHLAGKENTKLVEQLNSEEFTMRSEGSSKDVEAGTCNPNCELIFILKICVGVRFLQTVSINVADKLINGSTGTIVYIHFNNSIKILLGEIYVKFDEPTAGNSLKYSRLGGVLKECVLIKANSTTFSSLKRKKLSRWKENSFLEYYAMQ